jgi:excisionase family DNA binding protein
VLGERESAKFNLERCCNMKMNSVPKSDWLTAAEAAEYLKTNRRSLLLWARHGKIRGYVLSGTRRRIWRFRKEDLDAGLLSNPVVTCATPAVLKGKEN